MNRPSKSRPAAPSYPIRELPAEAEEQDPIVRDLNNVDVLPLVASNLLSVDENDGFSFVNTYKLNKHFTFIEPVEQGTLDKLHYAGMGPKFAVAYTNDIATFLSPYSHLILRQLKYLGQLHGISVEKIKAGLTISLLEHVCGSHCNGYRVPLLFQLTKLNCKGPFSTRTAASMKSAETDRKTRAAKNKAATERFAEDEDIPEGATRQELRVHAIDQSRKPFPYMASSQHLNRTIGVWQTEMDPPKLLLLPCAVCGRRIVRKLLSLENQLEYDLTVLQNPCLPVYVEPTTYNFATYDRAIFCPAALKNRGQKGPMDMCGECVNAYWSCDCNLWIQWPNSSTMLAMSYQLMPGWLSSPLPCMTL